MKRTIVFFAILALSTGIAVAQDEQYEVNIQPSPVSAVLEAFADQTGLQVVYLAEVVEGLESQGFSGSGTAAEVLTVLLAGTGLEWRFENERTVAISRPDAEPGEGPEVDEKARFGGNIVITATRVEEGMQDVPMSVQVLTQAMLEDRGIQEFTEIVREVPSLNVSELDRGSLDIGIRGITSLTPGLGGATIGYYIDEISVAASAAIPQLATVDVERVEVLRGPQGVLFGEGSLGGAIRFISNPPNTQELSGRIRLGASTISKGSSNRNLEGVVNVPVVKDRFALRLVGHYLSNGGFIDNVAPGFEEEDYNVSEVWGGRLSALWTPTDRLKITPRITVQRDTFTGMSSESLQCADPDVMVCRPTTTTPIGDLEAYRPIAFDSENKFSQPSLIIEYAFDRLYLTSATSYYDQESGSTTPGLSTRINGDRQIFNQEVRLNSIGGGRWSWLAGVFYKTEKGGSLITADVLGGLRLESDLDLEQAAIFGNVGYAFSERLTLDVGARFFREDVKESASTTIVDLPFLDSATIGDGANTETTPRFALSWTASDNTLVYGTVAKGFRRGVVNLFSPDISPEIPSYVPPITEPDKLWSYEVGVKSAFGGGRGFVNAAVYYIDWDQIQVADVFMMEGMMFGYVFNGGKAKAQGLEFALGWLATDSLNLGLNGAFSSAKLEGDVGMFLDGDEIKQVPGYLVSGFVDYRRPALRTAILLLRADLTFRDSVISRTGGDPALVTAAAYGLLNLRAGLMFEGYGVYLYVNNALDKRAEYSLDAAVNGLLNRNIPRTIGVDVGFNF